jgi:3-deoxy-D-manno-octulosonic-acid transferase
MWNVKAKKWTGGRKNWKTSLSQNIHHEKPIIWIHAASLGEFEQGRPIIEKIKTNHPAYNILLTFFSPSGYEVRKNYNQADFVCYLPLDTKRNAGFFLDLVKPAKIIFIKYELWYHYINEASRRHIPVFVASAIFRPNQLFFRTYGKWYLNVLKSISHFFVQNNVSMNLLVSKGIEQATVTGDTRYDRVFENAQNVTENPIAAHFVKKYTTLIAGSTWPADEDLVIRYINEHPHVKLILAPHEIEANHIKSIEKKLMVPYTRYSQATNTNVHNYQVLIIDNIGMLSSLYQYASVAFIGGGFGKGIHNILEAVTFGLPVLFGPNYHKFQEAIELIDFGGAHAIRKYDELQRILDGYLDNTNHLNTQQLNNKSFIAKRTGATEIILKIMFN